MVTLLPLEVSWISPPVLVPVLLDVLLPPAFEVELLAPPPPPPPPAEPVLLLGGVVTVSI